MKHNFSIHLVLLFAIGIFTFNACSSDDEVVDDDVVDCIEETWYADLDGDGFGDPDNSQSECIQPTDYVQDNTDFDDANATAYPGADEICGDGIDNDGDGEIDNENDCSVINQISGNWTSNFGDSIHITESSLSISTASSTPSFYLYHILAKESNYIICLNDANNPFDAERYSKFVFTNISINQLNYCLPFYDSPSQEFIESSNDPTDTNDLEAGCGGFPWSIMTRD